MSFTISHRSRSYPFLMKKRSTSINFYRFSYTSTIPCGNSCCKVIQITSASNIILKPFYFERLKIYSSGVKLKSAGQINLWFPFLLLLSVFSSFPPSSSVHSNSHAIDRVHTDEAGEIFTFRINWASVPALYCSSFICSIINWRSCNTNIMDNNRLLLWFLKIILKTITHPLVVHTRLKLYFCHGTQKKIGLFI